MSDEDRKLVQLLMSRLWKVYGSRNSVGEIKGFEAPMTFTKFCAALDAMPEKDETTKETCQ